MLIKNAVLKADEKATNGIECGSEAEFVEALLAVEERLLNKCYGVTGIFTEYGELSALSTALDGKEYFSKYAQRVSIGFSILNDKLAKKKLFLFATNLIVDAQTRRENREIKREEKKAAL